jgi:hypothetical protein
MCIIRGRQRGFAAVARAESGQPTPPGRKNPPTPQQMAEKDKLINLLVDCKTPDEVRFLISWREVSHPVL